MESRDKSGKVGRGNPPVETRFKKGQSGNPKGHPKGQKNLKTLIREVLDATEVQVNGKKVTADYAIIAKEVQLALQGNLKAIEMLHDRLEGKPPQKNEVTGKDGVSLFNGVTIEYGTAEIKDRLITKTTPSDSSPEQQ